MKQEFDVSAEELLRTLKRRGIPLPSEIGAFITLEICEQIVDRPVEISTEDVAVSEIGEVLCASNVKPTTEAESVRMLLGLLADLLVCAAPGVPAMLLELVQDGPSGGVFTLDRLRGDLEASLLPLNRGATRRVLARLLREVRKPAASARAPLQPSAADIDAQFDALLGADAGDAGGRRDSRRNLRPRVADGAGRSEPGWTARGESPREDRARSAHAARSASGGGPDAREAQPVAPKRAGDAVQLDTQRDETIEQRPLTAADDRASQPRGGEPLQPLAALSSSDQTSMPASSDARAASGGGRRAQRAQDESVPPASDGEAGGGRSAEHELAEPEIAADSAADDADDDSQLMAAGIAPSTRAAAARGAAFDESAQDDAPAPRAASGRGPAQDDASALRAASGRGPAHDDAPALRAASGRGPAQDDAPALRAASARGSALDDAPGPGRNGSSDDRAAANLPSGRDDAFDGRTAVRAGSANPAARTPRPGVATLIETAAVSPFPATEPDTHPFARATAARDAERRQLQPEAPLVYATTSSEPARAWKGSGRNSDARPRALSGTHESASDLDLDALIEAGDPRPRTGLWLLGLSVVASLALVLGYLTIGRDRARDALGLLPQPTAAAEPSRKAAPAAREYGDLLVDSEPPRAQVLLLIGPGPALATDLPLGVAQEFVAVADGYVPARALLPHDALWEDVDGKPRYELAIQATQRAAEGAPLRLGHTLLPQDVGTPQARVGTVRVVTTPRAANVYQLIGFTPGVRVEHLPLDRSYEILVYLEGRAAATRQLSAQDFEQQGPQRAAHISLSLPPEKAR